MMINFKPLTIHDASWARPLLWEAGEHGAEYSFANALIWGNFYKMEAARIDDFLLSRSAESSAYMYPRGKGDMRYAINCIMQDARERGAPLVLRGLSQTAKEELERLFPSKFDYTPLRDFADYVYTVKDLSELVGRKFQPKRNLASRFMKTYNWNYEAITAENIEECVAMSREWCRLNCCEEDGGMAMENSVAIQMLNCFFALDLKGGLLRVDGKVIAFTIGEPLNKDTFIVHIEKAFTEYAGAYQMINRQFICHNALDFVYVNREDDAGDLGLRKAKESYQPVFMQEKYLAVRVEN
ncbi:MAG: phosphatidylglycerol lysyltransferase domain-containing protein [Bacteroidales bacterium]|nr:phosphatidylglycerol lysyltransferase domain-containing protein [Bacteroidales bacterium]MCL2133807.1 phosphatidylglycerol lysyltransferase domain-containing protein [Bacteroidales bacterium]